VRDRTVFLHIGAPKTGTTYLQNILFTNRGKLRRAGLLYPGNAVRSHFWASQDLRGTAFHGHVEPQVAGAWERLVDQIRGFAGNAIIDHEILAAASADQIDRALADLNFADVHIVFTARDIARQLPAAWQERIKNKDTLTYREFLDGVHAGLTGTGPRKYFWPLHDVPEILARWSRNVPPEHVHVVTLPPSGGDPTLLWRRFAGVLGLDPDAYDTDLGRENTSLTAAEAAVLRQLNLQLDDIAVPWPVYRSAVKHGLSGALGGESRSAGRIELPEGVYAWVVAWSQQAVADLAAARYAVAGDLAEFLPAARPTGADPDAVPAEEQVAAATRMLAAMLNLMAKDSSAQHGGSPAASPGGSAELARRVAGRATRVARLAALRRRE
jgi:hypothetical protein